MESSKTGLTALGKHIRATLDEELAQTSVQQEARAQLLRRVTLDNAARVRNAPKFSALWRWSTAAALCAVVGGGIALWRYQERPLSFAVAGGSPGRVGDLLEAHGPEPVELQFSDGSSIFVQDQGRVRVLSTAATGARVLLESGVIDVNIRHERLLPTAWSFDAGAYRVQVTGTAFVVAYEPQQQALNLATHSGSVTVSGPCLSEPRNVSAGASVQLACEATPRVQGPLSGAMPLGSLPATQPFGLTQAEASASGQAPVLTVEAAAAAASIAAGFSQTAQPEKALAPRAGDWRSELQAGNLADALNAAERAGFEQVCASANLKQLVELATAARLAGKPRLAVSALRSVRARFAGTPEAGTAAFTLGRIAFEQRGAYSEAVTWFSTYVSEMPAGPLLGDALGRLMEARQRAGDHVGARADARRYLTRFPAGPYAVAAKRILAE